jgi:hypothetical protein
MFGFIASVVAAVRQERRILEVAERRRLEAVSMSRRKALERRERVAFSRD